MTAAVTPNFVSFLYVAMMIISILVTIIYIYFNWNNKLFGRLMSITFIFITYGLFTSFCAAQGFFIYLPHVARTGFLALLIITPLLYLSIIRGLTETGLKRKDWLHFIPALLYLINFLPFFLLSTQEKQELIKIGTFTTFDEGWLFPKYFVLFMSLSQILFYLIISVKRLILNKLHLEHSNPFVYTFFFYLILLLIPPIGAAFSDYSGNNPSQPILLTYISTQLIFFLILLGQPNFLYAKQNRKPEKDRPKIDQQTLPEVPKSKNQFELTLNPEADLDSKRILGLILDNFEKEKPYLNFEFDQQELSEKLNLSGYQIRTTLKNVYSISFSDFVNYHRIQFFLKMLEKDPRWRNYTMATLANSIGFKSTNSLYLASKKFIKTTPKEYIDELINQK